jgi:hypothetical protein
MVTEGEAGRVYTLQSSTNLAPATWQDVLSFTNIQGQSTISDTSSPIAARAFYRLEQHDYAPASIAGRSVTVDIVNGDGLFAPNGSYRISTAAVGNTYTLTALSGPIASSNGTYTYTKTGRETAVLVMTDKSSMVTRSTIYYTDSNRGEAVTIGVTGVFGHQFGMFFAN